MGRGWCVSSVPRLTAPSFARWFSCGPASGFSRHYFLGRLVRFVEGGKWFFAQFFREDPGPVGLRGRCPLSPESIVRRRLRPLRPRPVMLLGFYRLVSDRSSRRCPAHHGLGVSARRRITRGLRQWLEWRFMPPLSGFGSGSRWISRALWLGRGPLPSRR